MSVNLIKNASALEGAAGWNATSGGVLDAQGPAGRRFVRVSWASALSSNITGSTVFSVTAGQAVSARMLLRHENIGSTSANPGAAGISAVLTWHGSGGFISYSPLQVVRRAPAQAGSTAFFGLAANYDLLEFVGVAPAGTTSAYLQVVINAPPNPIIAVYLLRPMVVVGAALPDVWSPGPAHANTDLNLPVWPPQLGPVLVDGLAAANFSQRVGFAVDGGAPLVRRAKGLPWTRFTGSVLTDVVQAEALDLFARSTPEPFWFVNPLDQTLRRARFEAEGEPVHEFSGAGWFRSRFSLLLEPA